MMTGCARREEVRGGLALCAALAQLEEREICNLFAGGANPSCGFYRDEQGYPCNDRN